MLIEDEIQAGVKYSIVLPKNPEKTLYWLHGYRGDSQEFIHRYKKVEELAEKYKIAIVMPTTGDYEYFDTDERCSAKLLGEVLVKECRKKYNLSNEKENTYIAGVSMGGYGALLLGARYGEIFGKIAAVSGAFIQNDIYNGNPEVVGTGEKQAEEWHKIFGDFSELEFSSERNPYVASCKALETNSLPPIFLSCGADDMLYQRNIYMKTRLSEKGADITWYPHEGKHDWESFAIEETFRWLAVNWK